nr:phage/plasmid replication protein, II/X family [Mannheimia pernigra]
MILKRSGLLFNSPLCVNSPLLTFEIDGDLDVQELSHPYESIPSHFSSLAMKIFNGSDRMKTPPYVELKASPAKLFQGHNVFGSTDLEICAFVMLSSFIKAMLELYEMVDIEQTSVDWIDVTYSAHIDSESTKTTYLFFPKYPFRTNTSHKT